MGTLCWGKLAKDYRFKSLFLGLLFAVHLFKSPKPHSLLDGRYVHTQIKGVSCKSKGEGKWVKEKKKKDVTGGDERSKYTCPRSGRGQAETTQSAGK